MGAIEITTLNQIILILELAKNVLISHERVFAKRFMQEIIEN